MRSAFIAALLLVFSLPSSLHARLWPWPEDFEVREERWLGDQFITIEEGDSLAKQELCFDCHDGSVADDRELWDPELFGHRVGIAPVKPLPEGIPLADGKLYCGSCHLPHGGLPGTRAEVKEPFLRLENTNDVFCVACHQERATPGPQAASLNHSFLKKARQDTATANPAAWDKIQALGGKVGKDGATRCQSCHRSHGAPSRSSLIAPVKESELCSICHHDIKDSRIIPNHPLHAKSDWKGEGKPETVECLTCHKVHEAPVPGVLLVGQGEGLCLPCHPKNRLLDDDGHQQEKLLKIVRESAEPVGSGYCGACHKTHRAGNALLARWTAGAPSADPDSRFCIGCHGAGKSLAEDQIGPYYHFTGPWPEASAGATRPPPDGSLPLLDPAGRIPEPGVGGAGRAVGCRTCHFMHDRPLGAGRKRPSNNLRQAASKPGACLVCHPDREAILHTNHNVLLVKKKAVRERFDLKGDDPCSACHVVHRARTAMLFPDPVFASPETDQESAACLSCHGANSQRAETGVGAFSHPIGPWPVSVGSDKRPGDLIRPEGLPLFRSATRADGGGGIDEPGCLSCGTCHRLHPGPAEEEPAAEYLRDPLRQTQACVVCHAGQRTVKKTKHSIRDPKLVGEIESQVGKSDEKHECAPCHKVHNGAGEGLWFVPIAEPKSAFEQDERSRRCLSCHDHKAFKKIREKNGHPIGKPMKKEYMPSEDARLHLGRIAADDAGLRDVVVCATCHLNHGVENPDGSVTLFAGGGVPEGDLCVLCHRANGAIVGSPHDFRTRGENEYHPDDGRSVKFGVCAGCHANHEALIERSLIAFSTPAPKGRGNPDDMFCLRCHLDPRIRKDRPIRFYVHPTGSEALERLEEKEKREAAGGGALVPGVDPQAVIMGYETLSRIRCVTCHDNHRWTSLVEAGDVEDLAGTEMTSFLRGSGVAETYCAKCHGMESLYRYRLYHQDRAFLRRTPNQ